MTAVGPAETASGPTDRTVLRDPGFVRLWVATTASGLATWALPFVLGLAIVDGDLDELDLGLVLAARTVGFLVLLPAGGSSPTGTPPGRWWASRASSPPPAPCRWRGRSGARRPCSWRRPSSWEPVRAPAAPPSRRSCRHRGAVAPPGGQRRHLRRRARLHPRRPGRRRRRQHGRRSRPPRGRHRCLWVTAALAPPRPAATAPDDGADASPSTAGRRGFLAELGEGFGEARRHPWFLAGLGALTTVIMAGYSVTAVALPIVSRGEGSPALLAASATAYTLGALVGGVAIARLRLPSEGWVALGGLATYALAPLALIGSAPVALVAGAYLVAGVGIELFNVPWFTATQREVAPDRLSRVSSLDFLVSYGLAPVGLAVIAPAIDTFGMDAVLVVCAVACALGPAAAAVVPTSRWFGRGGDGDRRL